MQSCFPVNFLVVEPAYLDSVSDLLYILTCYKLYFLAIIILAFSVVLGYHGTTFYGCFLFTATFTEISIVILLGWVSSRVIVS